STAAGRPSAAATSRRGRARWGAGFWCFGGRGPPPTCPTSSPGWGGAPPAPPALPQAPPPAAGRAPPPRGRAAPSTPPRRLPAPADVHGAEICFRRALAVSRSQSARALELRAATSLARLLERRGQREDGRALVAPLYRGFREGLETEDLARARACLDEPERH